MTLSIPPTGQTLKTNPGNPWEQDFNEMNNKPGADDSDQEEAEFIAEGQINRPAHRNPFYNFPLILVGTLGAFGMVGYMFFGNLMSSPEAPKVAKSPTPGSTLDNTDQQRLAESQAKLAMGGSQKAFESHNNPASRTPSSNATSSPPAAKPTTPPAATKASPPVVVAKAPPQIIYRTMPQPIAKATTTTSQTPPQSFIPLGNGQQPQRRQKKVRPPRQPLVASEKALMDSLKPKAKATPAVPTGDPLIAGSSAGAHLMATLQFNSQSQNGQTMQVVLEQPLKTNNGSGLSRGSVLLFQVFSNPQSGAVTATSGDALINGKLVRMQKGAISIQSPNGDPLIAKSYRPGMDGLAAADRNNAILSAASTVGDELTKGSATTVIGNGSTVVSQNNSPNILGAVAKGAFGGWSTDQRQRTQAEANKILAAPPVQILPRDTRFLVTVTFPTPISFTR